MERTVARQDPLISGCDLALQGQLHEDLVVWPAVNNDVPREAATFDETKALIEGPGVHVGVTHLDYEFLIASFACEGCGCVPELAANTSPPPGWEQERSHLTDMRR